MDLISQVLTRRTVLKRLGSFLEGEKHGKGIFHDAQNDDYEEEWTNGELTRKAPLSPFKKNNSSILTSFTINKRSECSKT